MINSKLDTSIFRLTRIHEKLGEDIVVASSSTVDFAACRRELGNVISCLQQYNECGEQIKEENTTPETISKEILAKVDELNKLIEKSKEYKMSILSNSRELTNIIRIESISVNLYDKNKFYPTPPC